MVGSALPAPPPTSYQSGQAYREEGSVTPWKPMAGSAGPGEGWEGCAAPQKTPWDCYPIVLSDPHRDGQAWGGVCAVPGDTLTPECLAWLADGNSLPPLPLVYTLTLWEVLLASGSLGPVDQHLHSVGDSLPSLLSILSSQPIRQT